MWNISDVCFSSRVSKLIIWQHLISYRKQFWYQHYFLSIRLTLTYSRSLSVMKSSSLVTIYLAWICLLTPSDNGSVFGLRGRHPRRCGSTRRLDPDYAGLAGSAHTGHPFHTGLPDARKVSAESEKFAIFSQPVVSKLLTFTLVSHHWMWDLAIVELNRTKQAVCLIWQTKSRSVNV